MSPPAPEPTAPPVPHLEAKAALLLVVVAMLLAGAVLYLLYARGTFDKTQWLNLIADDAEGAVVGMDLTFAGFPIGRVRSLELARDGSARIVVDLPLEDAHWLRTSSVFTLTRGVVGGTALRAYTGIPTDPPLPEDATRKVLVGDATAEIPRLVADVRTLVQHLGDLTAPDSPLAASLANVQRSTARLAGPQGALGLLLGKDADSKRIASAIARTDALLARLDALVANADRQVFGSDGAVHALRASIAQLDAVLADAQGAASNVRSATTDLGALRAEVEASLRRVQALIDEVNRKWPFARD